LTVESIFEQIKLKFKGTTSFTRMELFEFLQDIYPGMKETTFRWRIYDLKRNQIIYAMDKNRFTLNDKPLFQPVLENRQRDIYQRIHREFPGIKVCIWSTKWIHEFMLHQPGKFFTVLEVEKGAEEIVFHFLQDNKIRNVYLIPSVEILDNYVNQNPDSVVIKSLVTKAPLKEFEHIVIPQLEKILVDLLADPGLFQMFLGSELIFIYNSAFERYHVNTTWMLNYASRRQKKEDLAQFLELKTNAYKSY
jgi:hypothetical protein